MRRLRVCLAVIGLSLLVPAMAIAAQPRVWTGRVLKVRPGLIRWTGDATGFLGGRARRTCHTVSCFGRLQWTTWNSTEGVARGVDWVNDCNPDCAGGSFSARPTTVHVYRPRRLHGQLVFTRLSFIATGHRRITLSLILQAGEYSW